MKFVLRFIFAWTAWQTLAYSTAVAGLEAIVGADAATYPLPAAELTGEVGYELPIWQIDGDLKKSNGYRYGYLHPFIGGASAGTYQLVTGALEVYPISFFTVQAGTSWQKNSTTYSGFDCKRYQCEGEISNFFLESALEFEVDRFAGDLRFHHDQWKPEVTPHVATIDPTSGLLLANRERQNKITADLLWEWPAHWQSFISGNYIQGLDTRGFSRAAGVGGIYTFKHYALTFGGGLFKSQLKPAGAVFFTQFSWYLKPGLSHKNLLEDNETESKLH